MSTLTIKLADGTDQRITLTKDVTTVGRDPQNDVVINDGSISTFHADLRLENGVHILRDAGSTNGIRVNGDRVTEANLNDGDLLRFGSIAGTYVGTKVAAVAAPPRPTENEAVREVADPRPSGDSIAGTAVQGFGSKSSGGTKDPLQQALVGLGILGIVACLVAMVMSITM